MKSIVSLGVAALTILAAVGPVVAAQKQRKTAANIELLQQQTALWIPGRKMRCSFHNKEHVESYYNVVYLPYSFKCRNCNAVTEGGGCTGRFAPDMQRGCEAVETNEHYWVRVK